ncbi:MULTISPECIES: alpha-hydroxy acid oxidase [unclassified Sphingomonas]|jgi:4-hydroxymandelate oxidase|uniref:alpha-hydroxy acid oxidase n=1 Tax=unclassified Sphingomonas TaxID=196159 RepID=UPI0009DEA6A2|nr:MULTISPECIES: alpha-hydroxy acid oxidase [unclassified Sphingomonas]MDY1007353.1 alpha-hydroxy acid oxidase [Sphingomonas sp. CFBP9019]
MRLNIVLCIEDLERDAQSILDPGTWAYVAGGAGAGTTIAWNRRALDCLFLSPAVLTSAAQPPDLSIRLFNRVLPTPILLAPTSPQRLLHPEAELATARGASSSSTTTIISTDSHYPFDEIVRAGSSDCWFQLYCYRSRNDIGRTLDYAAESGARAIVVTVDADHGARRIAAQRAGFTVPATLDFGTLRALGLFDGAVPGGARLDRMPLSWAELNWIRARTRLPLLVKGLLRPVDALRALDEGADGLIVSNHGGRQLDGALPAVLALKTIAQAVDRRVPILFDGGIRSGIDIVRALALGASAVCVGRPYLWGLAAYGEDGVATCLQILADEFRDSLLQLGLGSVSEIAPGCVAGSAFPLAMAAWDGLVSSPAADMLSHA